MPTESSAEVCWAEIAAQLTVGIPLIGVAAGAPPNRDEAIIASAKSRADGLADSARRRALAILTAPGAGDRAAMAEHLAFKTDLGVADAVQLLAAAPASGAVDWSEISTQLNNQMKGVDPRFIVPKT